MTVTTIEVSKEYLHFAAAHFTIFSATERENLHGHNFHVQLEVTAPVGSDGLTFDYNILKNSLKALCDAHDEKTLMPADSPHLTFETDNQYQYVLFADERIPFLPRDVMLLPIRNVTVEELSEYFLKRMVEHPDIAAEDIHQIVLRCSSGEGQWARAVWNAG
ncbi:MAG: 6-carboxytetrahydropterin synthase [Pseudomonadota bacterium]